MHLLRNISFAVLFGVACFPQATRAAIPVDKKLEAKVEKTLSKMTLEEKIGQMTELSIDVLGEWKDGEFQLNKDKVYNAIPCIYGLDQNHGTTYTLDGTLFPQNINLGASFNPQLAYDAATVTAYETRAANCPWTYSPTVDMARDPRWSRVWENYGEDCLVNAVMGSAAVRGFQGDDPNHIPSDRIAASVKHYMGYSQARTGKDRTPAYIPIRNC